MWKTKVDIVERLRLGTKKNGDHRLLLEAAREIVRLRKYLTKFEIEGRKEGVN
jgi:hypothetical protein